METIFILLGPDVPLSREILATYKERIENGTAVVIGNEKDGFTLDDLSKNLLKPEYQEKKVKFIFLAHGSATENNEHQLQINHSPNVLTKDIVNIINTHFDNYSIYSTACHSGLFLESPNNNLENGSTFIAFSPSNQSTKARNVLEGLTINENDDLTNFKNYLLNLKGDVAPIFAKKEDVGLNIIDSEISLVNFLNLSKENRQKILSEEFRKISDIKNSQWETLYPILISANDISQIPVTEYGLALQTSLIYETQYQNKESNQTPENLRILKENLIGSNLTDYEKIDYIDEVIKCDPILINQASELLSDYIISKNSSKKVLQALMNAGVSPNSYSLNLNRDLDELTDESDEKHDFENTYVTPLANALFHHKDDLEFTKILLRAGARVNFEQTPELNIDLIIATQKKLDIIEESLDLQDPELLQLAINNGLVITKHDLNILRYQIDKFKADSPEKVPLFESIYKRAEEQYILPDNSKKIIDDELGLINPPENSSAAEKEIINTQGRDALVKFINDQMREPTIDYHKILSKNDVYKRYGLEVKREGNNISYTYKDRIYDIEPLYNKFKISANTNLDGSCVKESVFDNFCEYVHQLAENGLTRAEVATLEKKRKEINKNISEETHGTINDFVKVTDPNSSIYNPYESSCSGRSYYYNKKHYEDIIR